MPNPHHQPRSSSVHPQQLPHRRGTVARRTQRRQYRPTRRCIQIVQRRVECRVDVRFIEVPVAGLRVRVPSAACASVSSAWSASTASSCTVCPFVLRVAVRVITLHRIAAILRLSTSASSPSLVGRTTASGVVPAPASAQPNHPQVQAHHSAALPSTARSSTCTYITLRRRLRLLLVLLLRIITLLLSSPSPLLCHAPHPVHSVFVFVFPPTRIRTSVLVKRAPRLSRDDPIRAPSAPLPGAIRIRSGRRLGARAIVIAAEMDGGPEPEPTPTTTEMHAIARACPRCRSSSCRTPCTRPAFPRLIVIMLPPQRHHPHLDQQHRPLQHAPYVRILLLLIIHKSDQLLILFRRIFIGCTYSMAAQVTAASLLAGAAGSGTTPRHRSLRSALHDRLGGVPADAFLDGGRRCS
ncbi:hypothetical protein C8J57DRAFT_120124 [Mycena rebaudengoi]|nr:hypothetical protein C8J57DRAFT_120124 [Mycena rebaudengoi]